MRHRVSGTCKVMSQEKRSKRTCPDRNRYKEGRRVVTSRMEHKQTFIRAHHDPPVYGHPGINKTYQLTSHRYWWPNMQQEVKDYVRGCAECQWNKINTRPTKAPLSPIFPTHEAMLFETVALDFITKLPVSQGVTPRLALSCDVRSES